MKRKKNFVSILLIAVFLGIFIFCSVPFVLDASNKPVSSQSEEVLVVIEEDLSTFAIGSVLEKSGVIRSRLAFLLKAKKGKFNNLLWGSYTLNKNMTINEILLTLSTPKAEVKTITVTFPEGYTLEQMALLCEEKGLITKEAFYEALNSRYDFHFLKNIPNGQYNYALQGFLFPDTYEFFEDSDAEDIIFKMLSQFEAQYLSLNGSLENVFEIITKASIIEKEAKLEKERTMVAGVIENRLMSNMPLQVDATVLYDATDGLFDRTESGFIAERIKNLDSPYNTYKYAGLPAGPICNPGFTSIEAALNPKEHSYLYYHTDTTKNDGSHIFTETLNEHVQTMN